MCFICLIAGLVPSIWNGEKCEKEQRIALDTAAAWCLSCNWKQLKKYIKHWRTHFLSGHNLLASLVQPNSCLLRWENSRMFSLGSIKYLHYLICSTLRFKGLNLLISFRNVFLETFRKSRWGMLDEEPAKEPGKTLQSSFRDLSCASGTSHWTRLTSRQTLILLEIFWT